MKKISVFTPTYNRAYILPRCYKALCEQTNKDFIWLVVDDGSTDDTKKLIESWISDNIITIQYIYQENGGKQKAVNTGVLNCTTEYFAFLDSDDYYEKNTVERFIIALDNIKNNHKIAGVLARRGTPDRKIIGNPYLPQKEFVANFDYLVKKYNFSGDTCRAYKTNVLREHLYPEIEDKFILEDAMLSSIDRKHDLYIINEVFSISEYLPDGYTTRSKDLYKNNPHGYALGINQLTIAKRGFIRKLKVIIIYTTWCWKYKIDRSFYNCKNRKLYVLAFPLSVLCYVLKLPRWIYK